MDKTLHDLGRILLNGIPTFLIVLFLIIYLRAMFFGPLARVLRRRYDETAGAEKAAAESMLAAEGRIAEYEEKLRAARAEIYSEQDRIFKDLEREHAAGVATARREADAHVARASADLQAEAAEARQTLEERSGELADRIVASVLEGRAA